MSLAYVMRQALSHPIDAVMPLTPDMDRFRNQTRCFPAHPTAETGS
jgi:hypothetical protein